MLSSSPPLFNIKVAKDCYMNKVKMYEKDN